MIDDTFIGEQRVTCIRRMSFRKALTTLQDAERLPVLVERLAEGDELIDVKQVVTLENVFQHRDLTAGRYDSERHVRELTNALKNMPADERRLDPILVMPIDGVWLCIDGHHRLEAYAQMGVGKVPAKPFSGSVQEAVVAAGESNSKTKLPMSPRDRMNAAWKLVSANLGSKRATAAATGVAPRTVANMRRLTKTLTEMGVEAGDYGYHEARQLEKGGLLGNRGDDWEDRQVQLFEDKLARALGTHAHRNREFVAMAMENIYPSVVEAVIERSRAGEGADDDW